MFLLGFLFNLLNDSDLRVIWRPKLLFLYQN